VYDDQRSRRCVSGASSFGGTTRIVSTTPEDENEALVVHDRLRELVGKLAVNDSRIRRHAHGGVHHMRVTLRRLRSLLATFGPLYEEARVTSLRAELKWVAAELAGARDAEVVRERLHQLPTTEEEREVAEHVRTELDELDAEHVRDSVSVLDSDRYSRALSDLTDFVEQPPWSGAPASDDDLRPRVRRDFKRLRRRVRRSLEAGPGERDAALHEVRKAAKRLRYAAETMVPTHGDDASRLSRRAKRVQKDLGEVQDSAVAQATLRRLAEQPGRTTQQVFVLGVFREREQAHAEGAEATYDASWARLARKKNRRWLG